MRLTGSGCGHFKRKNFFTNNLLEALCVITTDGKWRAAVRAISSMWAVLQVSDQAVRLWQEGWFQTGAEPSGVSTLRNPKVPSAFRL